MGNTLGEKFKLTVAGESHGPAIIAIVDGCPSNLDIKLEDIQKELDRRKPGQSRITTERREEDKVKILSGIFEGKTLGTSITLIVYNKAIDSNKYIPIKDKFRPGHADYTYFTKYGIRDWRGGGFASGRVTVAMVAGGAIAKRVLQDYGIKIIGYVKEIGNIKAENIDYNEIEKNSVRCPDKNKAREMEEKILAVKAEGDSIGGLVEVVAKGVPAGLGEPRFEGLKGQLSNAFYSMGAVTCVEFGAGHKAKNMLGSEFNDQMYSENGRIRHYTNNAGGILGGISNGEDIITRVTIKPTPSIAKQQKTVDIYGNNVKIKIQGKHDPCICPRAVPVIESVTAIVLTDFLLQK